jgi:outer membrane protein
MNKIKRIITLIALISVTGEISFAQNLKFGHINSNEIIQSLPEFDTARAKLERLRQDLSKFLEAMSIEFNDKYNAYIKDNKILSDVVKQVKEQELSDMNRRIQEFQNNAQSQLQEKQTELFDPLYSKLDKAIRDTGKENDFLYIFDISQSNLLYFDKAKSIDITSLVKLKLGIK